MLKVDFPKICTEKLDNHILADMNPEGPSYGENTIFTTYKVNVK